MVFTSQICVFHARPTFSFLCIIDIFSLVQNVLTYVFYIYIYMYIHIDFPVRKLGEVFLAAAGAFLPAKMTLLGFYGM